MLASVAPTDRPAPRAPSTGHLAPGAAAASAVSALFVHEFDLDMARVLLPRPEIHLVVRLGSSARGGLDAHAFGVRQRAHRKLIQRGQRTVMARLRLGVPEAVLGAPASALTDRVVALEELWGDGAARRLFERLDGARDARDAASILESALSARLAATEEQRARARLALDAASRLASASVSAVADGLGVSERHLRRVFLETVGVSPKAFARLTRFHRALRAASERAHEGWASIATDAGYYDQAHLIAEFRAIAGATPRVLLGELREAPALG